MSTRSASGLNAALALTAALGRTESIEAIGEAALAAACDGVRSAGAALLLFDDARTPRVQASRGLDADDCRALEHGMPWRPDAEGYVQPVVVPNVRGRGGAFVRATFVPVAGVRGVLGALVLLHDDDDGPAFDAPETALLRVIAGAVASAVGRVRAERAAREHERQLRLLTDHAPVLLAHIDRARRYRFVNAPYAARFGLTAEEVVGRTIPEIVGEQAYATFRPYVDAVFEGRTAEFEVEIPYERLGRRVMQCSYAPEKDESGEVHALIAIIADVTERRAAEAGLRRSEERFRSLSACSPVGIFTTDIEGRCTYTNPRCQAIAGFSFAQALGIGWSDFVHLDDRARVFEEWSTTARAGLEYSGVFRWVHPSGAVRRAHIRTSPMLADDGTPIGHVGTVEDVTEREQAETALREGEARFRQLANTLPQMVWMARPDGYLDYFNERWYEFTGFSRGEGGDESWKKVLHPDDVQHCLDTWYASVRTGEPYEIEYRFFDRKTNAYRWFLGRALPMRDEAGRVVRWFGTCTDIDDQKRSGEISTFLAEASAAFGTISDYQTTLQTVARLAVPDFADWCVVSMAGPDGTLERLAVCHADPAKVELFREMDRRFPSHPDDPHGPRHVIRTGQPELVPDIPDAVIVRAAKSDEHLRMLRGLALKSYITVALKTAGSTLGAITYATAESGRRYGSADLVLAEELAYRAATAIENARLYSELREADRQKDEFLAVLAHELRNPLAPLRTALELSRLAADDSAMRGRAHNVMERQLQHLVRLVDDLLDVSRITRGSIELRRDRCELAAIVQNAVETSRPVIDAAGHELTVSLSGEAVYLTADPTRLAQVFSNLLNNAAKYTDRGGRIWLSAGAEHGEAVVRVRDSGIGIPPAMLTRVFDMFTQVDRSLEKAHGGLGIGLTLVKRLVELHGGTVEARSGGTGTGSEFLVRLPVAAAPERPDAPSSREALAVCSPVRCRILVVDDNRDAADSLALMLRVKGHEVRTAHDGLEAVEAAAAFRPDVVLLDLGMPRLNGYDAARRIRETLAPTGTTLVALTGWGQEEDRRRSRDAGFDHHLVKPVAPGMLDTLLAELRPATLGPGGTAAQQSGC